MNCKWTRTGRELWAANGCLVAHVYSMEDVDGGYAASVMDTERKLCLTLVVNTNRAAREWCERVLAGGLSVGLGDAAPSAAVGEWALGADDCFTGNTGIA